MEEVYFPYRGDIHLPLLHVVNHAGGWEKQDLDVRYDSHIGPMVAHEKLAAGEVQFVDGNHISPYLKRAGGDDWVYLGQSVTDYVVRCAVDPDADISDVRDLKGTRIAIPGPSEGTNLSHRELNIWLFLKQHGVDIDAGDAEFFKYGDLPSQRFKDKPIYQPILEGEADVAFLLPPYDIYAQEEGLEVLKFGEMPMIWYVTLASTFSYVEENPEIVDRFLKGFVEGMFYFRQHKRDSVSVIMDELGWDEQTSEHVYESIDEMLSPTLFPTPQAIANVYEEAVHWDERAAEVDPLEVWDLRPLRRVARSGFMDQFEG